MTAVTACCTCGTEPREDARFCDGCGTPVRDHDTHAEFKQVTVLFADVVGSMKLAAVLQTERLRDMMNELFNRAAAVVQRYQGTVDKFTGDGLMALFGAPVALEDHALRACISAMEIQSVAQKFADEVFRRDGVRLQVRVGLNSGEVITGEIGSGPGRYTAVGHPVGMAQRMEAAAPAGGVLCSLSTARLVGGAARLGPVEDVVIKGADAPAPARLLLAVESDRMVLGRNEGLMLGRDAELNWLRNLFDANRGCLIGIVGDPGLGKSRLISEFTAIAASRNADIVAARCEAHTTTVAFRALSRLLRGMFTVEGLSDTDAREHTAAHCEGLLTLHSADAQILFEAMGIADTNALPLQVSVDGRRRRLVEVMAKVVLARSARTVFVLEDAHWIDAPSDDVLAEFAATLNLTTSMLVTTYRPEFHGALHHHSGQTTTLQPLSESMAVRLVGQLLGDDPSLAGLAERIAFAAVGNPFFIEEIVRDLAGRGVLCGSRGSYRLVGDVDDFAVPATVQAVLAARIDRLPAETKSILNVAAVIGNQFDVDTLQTLLPDTESARLDELVSAELIDQTEFVPRQRYCFHHPLVRTVAYQSQLSATRAQAHSRLAAAIEARDPGAAADDNAALIATHLEAAGELAEAYRWHIRAAEWLRSRDLSAARAQWESARHIADRLSDDHDDVIAMRIAPRTMLMSTGFYVGGDVDTDECFREFRDLTMQTGDLRSLAIGTAGRIWSFSTGDNCVPEAAALASELEEMVSSIDCDAEAKSIMLNSVAFARFASCDFDAALRDIDAILALADGVPTAELASADALRGVIEMCLGDYEQGRRHLRTGTDQARALHPVRYAAVLHYSGTMAALGMCPADDLVDDAREALWRAESFGDVFGIIAAQWVYGTVLLRAESAPHDEAIDVLERARASIRKHKMLIHGLATIGADLAIDAARKGQRDEAIDDLRASFWLHMVSGFRVVVGCPGEALVGLLIERGSIDDFTEAHRIVDQWQARQPGIPALDLWWLKSRALLARAEGDSDCYAELANQYLSLCEKLDARGRLDEAHQMVTGIFEPPRRV
jgi:adenylate cyclase